MTEKKNNLLEINETQLMAALCYLGVLVLVPLFMRKTSDVFVYFHIKQGLVMLLALIIALLLSAWIAYIGNILFMLVILVDIVAMVQALLGKRWKIPVAGNLAEKFHI